MIKHLPKSILFLLVLAQIGAIGALDYYSGYELRISILYAFPVAFAAWHLNATVALMAAVICTGVAGWAELAAGIHYSEQWIPYANACPRLIFLLFVVLSISYFRRTLDTAHLRLRAFTGPLPICTHCAKIGGRDGYWTDFRSYVQENTDAQIQDKLCPDCARALYVNPVDDKA